MSVEVAVYLAVVALALAQLIWTGYSYSLQFEVGGRWDGYAPGLTPGWLLGRRVDLSDTQWREFRAAVPALAAVFAAFAGLSHLVRRAAAGRKDASRARVTFYLAFSALFLGYLHGFCALYVAALVAANWAVAQTVAGTTLGAAAVWAFNLGTLIAVRVWDGFPAASLLGPQFAWLDAHRGAVRWHICFNLTVLRMLSFGLDLHWARLARRSSSTAAKGSGSAQRSEPADTVPASQRPQGAAKVHSASAAAAAAAPPPPATDKARQQTPLPSDADYSLLLCMAHALYPPLYLAGPIITFQDFVWQLKESSSGSGGASSGRPPPRHAAWKYAGRLAADVLCIEAVTHFLYFNSLAVHRIGVRYRQHGLRYGAPEVGLTGWWVLSFMWLKFATLWRFFRLAALAEGIDPPENMVRCFADNYDVAGFWKGWHSSYNRWLVRYMYVPMGGTSRRLLSIWPIFFFVAIWHDLEWRLLSWAWLICAAFLPEMAAKRAADSPRLDGVRHTAAFRAVCAAAAALNIAALMAVNMVGFVVGLDGMADLFAQLLASPAYVAAALTSFFCGAQVIFAWRQREKEHKATATE